MSNQASSGPYRRRIMNRPLPGTHPRPCRIRFFGPPSRFAEKGTHNDFSALRAAVTDWRARGTNAAHAGFASRPPPAGDRPSGNGRRNKNGLRQASVRNRRNPRSSDRRGAIGRRIRECPRTSPAAFPRPPLRQRSTPSSSPPVGPGDDPVITREGEGEVLLAGNGLGVGESRQQRPIRASGRPGGHGGAPIAVEFDPDSVRLADHGVAGRGAERRSDEACASSFQSQPYEILDRLGCPPHLPAPMAESCGASSRETGLVRLFSSQARSRTPQELRSATSEVNIN